MSHFRPHNPTCSSSGKYFRNYFCSLQTKVGVVTWCSRDELGDGRLSLTSRLGFFTAARPRPGSLPLNSPQTVFPSALPPSSHVAKLVIATWQSRLQTKESSKEQRPEQRRLCFLTLKLLDNLFGCISPC